MEYEFDVFGDLNPEHGLHITKTRCPDLADKYIDHPGADLGRVLRGWLSDGAPAAPSSPVLAVVPPVPEHRAIPTTQAPKALPRGGQAAPVAPTDTEANTIAGPSMAAGPGSVSSGEMAKVPAAPVQEVDDAPVLAAIEEAQDLRGLYGARFKEAKATYFAAANDEQKKAINAAWQARHGQLLAKLHANAQMAVSLADLLPLEEEAKLIVRPEVAEGARQAIEKRRQFLAGK